MGLRSEAVLLLACLVLAGPVHAQFRSQSAISGVITTSSDVFSPSSGSATGSAGSSISVPPTVGAALNSTGMSLLGDLSQGKLVSTASPAVQKSIAGLLVTPAGASKDTAAAKALTKVLSKSNYTPTPDKAKTLVDTLVSLQGDGSVSPTQLRDAINAYNSYVDSATLECLAKPPGELLVIQAFLNSLTKDL
jgi:hypothetical protein